MSVSHISGTSRNVCLCTHGNLKCWKSLSLIYGAKTTNGPILGVGEYKHLILKYTYGMEWILQHNLETQCKNVP